MFQEEDDLTGPLEDRSCTDILFLLFFAAFLIGMVSQFRCLWNKTLIEQDLKDFPILLLVMKS